MYVNYRYIMYMNYRKKNRYPKIAFLLIVVVLFLLEVDAA